MSVNQKDYVKLEMLNQRLSELTQTIDLANTQIEHFTVALEMLSSLSTVKEGQELLVPIGGGSFVAVNASNVSTVKLSVGAGVVVDKPVSEAIAYITNQSEQVKQFSSQTAGVYDQVVAKILKLQEDMDSQVRGSNG